MKFFLIFSLSRCGSTAIFRALTSHPEITCLFEPDFSHAGWDGDELTRELESIRAKYNGIKHVWDPSGYPFVTAHMSSVTEMNVRRENVLRLNQRILECPDQRVVFLRRRNQLARIVSDLLGQQTNLWGPAHPDGHWDPAVDEPGRYRDAIKSRAITALSTDVMAWYLEHVPLMEDQLRETVSGGECLDVFYEDIFGSGLDLDARLSAFRRVVDFLGFRSFPASGAAVHALLDPRARLNSPGVLNLIPNLQQIKDRFPDQAVT
jgi:hypothetical protein